MIEKISGNEWSLGTTSDQANPADYYLLVSSLTTETDSSHLADY